MFHCGYYPEDDIYEQHRNFFVVAENINRAEERLASKMPKSYHIDGVLELTMVDGYRIKLEETTKDDPFFGWDLIEKTVMR